MNIVNEMIGQLLRRIAPANVVAVIALLFARPRSPLLLCHGYALSLKKRNSVDENGGPIPWMPYCVIELLRERLLPNMRVLEFGAGSSTLFFMTRVHSVFSIEPSNEWMGRLRLSASTNVRVVEVSAASADDYTRPVMQSNELFDLILVDGAHRVSSFVVALERLKPSGVVILDDSDRRSYAPIFQRAADVGLKVLKLHGHKPGSAGLHWAAIFYRSDNCLGL